VPRWQLPFFSSSRGDRFLALFLPLRNFLVSCAFRPENSCKRAKCVDGVAGIDSRQPETPKCYFADTLTSECI